jgi:hypothetical protein
LQAFASPWPPPSVVDIGLESAPAKRKMDVRIIRGQGAGARRIGPPKPRADSTCHGRAMEKRFRDFAGVMQCYILVRTSLATPPSLLPPASGRPSRWIHLLKAAGALELPS